MLDPVFEGFEEEQAVGRAGKAVRLPGIKERTDWWHWPLEACALQKMVPLAEAVFSQCTISGKSLWEFLLSSAKPRQFRSGSNT